MRATLRTGGRLVAVDCPSNWLYEVLIDGSAGELEVGPPPQVADITLVVEKSSQAFPVAGWDGFARGSWRRRGAVVIENACASGLDLLVRPRDEGLEVVARWRPPLAERGAAAVLRARGRMLMRQVLLQYPVLWQAGRRGAAPVHASVCCAPGESSPVLLVAGPSGVGKSTLVAAILATGGVASADNLCVTDGITAWGVVEPLRTVPDPAAEPDGGSGRRVSHGRRERTWAARADHLVPDMVVVLSTERRGSPGVEPLGAEQAARELVAGTYAAGELRRYWAFAAVLALGTGLGPAHPPLLEAAASLARSLPCRLVATGAGGSLPLELRRVRPGTHLEEVLQ